MHRTITELERQEGWEIGDIVEWDKHEGEATFEISFVVGHHREGRLCSTRMLLDEGPRFYDALNGERVLHVIYYNAATQWLRRGVTGDCDRPFITERRTLIVKG